jgi:pyridoxal/pyridoxine/pyridoxamine kinase
MLNGLTNMSKVFKFDVPFKELLESSIELALSRDSELILYIGYLGNPKQAAIICDAINIYQKDIKTIIVDPVCGDHGRTYVSEDVIEVWPKVISKAHLAFPNMTELKILTGHLATEPIPLQECASIFKNNYPNTKLVVTSIKQADNTSGVAALGKEDFYYTLQEMPKNYGGTGDALVSQFIVNHFYKSIPFNEALKLATDQTYIMIKNSYEAGADQLLY